jgi:glycine cleavage system P protein (glycine dehydrogenase)
MPYSSKTQVLTDEFCRRHIGIDEHDIATMLKTIGVSTLDELIAQTIPAAIRQHAPLNFGRAMSERETLAQLRRVAAKNRLVVSMIGQGYYGTILPPVIQRNILENPAWYTAYTPYQPEISQGRLEALLNFQTMISDLTGLEIANASLLDEATAAAEAMAMAQRLAGTKRSMFFVDADCHPQTIAVVRTRAAPLGWEIHVGDPLNDLDHSMVFGALLQYPGSCGEIRNIRPTIAGLHAAGALAVVAADPLALTLLTPPGELGADIAVGSTQRFGVPVGYGGPHAAYIATKSEYKRALPGRIVGVSIDSRGRPAYRLALQAREQHIRREKATSNICTAQVLLAVIASMYGVYHGPDGLRTIATRIHRLARVLARGLARLGWPVRNRTFFDTIAIDAGEHQEAIVGRARDLGINLRSMAARQAEPAAVGISCDEATTPELIEEIWKAFGSADGSPADLLFVTVDRSTDHAIAGEFARQSEFMRHPVFHRHRSETNLLRYMRRLADRDLALDRSMIPLGSCTMKLNATAEMIPITWPEFSDLHPFAPVDQASGYTELFSELCRRLCDITGYDAFSLQPNSGAQGEYAGLLAIRAYHRSNGQTQRNICLIPSSAHGTNPASAQLAGMTIVVVKCNQSGDVDLQDLRTKATQHADRLAACMVTYPSTHGVFEEDICDICDIVHRHGGQVYLDGANLNAQVGLSRPGDYGADVSHINLHKTFCIPHGGGGPGMGPIGVKAHLAPFLPGHPQRPDLPRQVGPVSATPFGSASILPISWAYILMMGGEGLVRATQAAILNANYIAARLQDHFPVLFRGRRGRVAHECILDMRPFKGTAGIGVEDIAKRLIDYGFHAPTISFPVAGTLMVEPTESESKAELDRFCDAMIEIRGEIAAIEAGRLDRDNNPLRNAPHTVFDLVDDGWQRPYARAQGCFPVAALCKDKYWPPVNRIDNAHGDRNLICSCPPLDLHQEAAE